MSCDPGSDQYDIGNYRFNCVAEDAAGNSDTCSFDVEVLGMNCFFFRSGTKLLKTIAVQSLFLFHQQCQKKFPKRLSMFLKGIFASDQLQIHSSLRNKLAAIKV